MHYFKKKEIQILLASLCWALTIYLLIWHLNYFNGVDAYYHVEIAEIMKLKGIVLKGFPWADCSIWREHFFDKDWLFHIYLIPFLLFGKFAGGKAAIITAVFIGGIVWGYLLKALKVQHIFLALIVMLSTYGFIFRLTMCRGHLLSVVLLPLCLTFIIKNKKSLFFIFVIVYSLAYTGAWQIFPIAILFDLIQNYKNNKRNKFINLFSIYAAAGLIISYLINPYFPNNLYGQFVQNYVVLKASWLGLKNVNINLGNEFNPMTDRRLFTHFLVFVVLMFITWGNLVKKIKKQSRMTLFLCFVSLVYFSFSIISVKFVEYSVPLGIVLAAVFWDTKLSVWKSLSAKNKNTFIAVMSVLIIYLLAVYSYYVNEKPQRASILYSGASDYLTNQLSEKDKTNIVRPGKIVFTADWDDAPALFYGAPQYKYLVFLDPCFMYVYSPEKYKIWYKVSEGKSLFPVDDITKNFNAGYIFLTKDKGRLDQALSINDKVELVYEGPEKEKLYRIIKHEK